ncbi:MAG: AbrB/MazE/SpoVT family DNA-binding domain-containing protein [Chloroflexi bacterium]|nr:MAG: AbrB/MazE/SpoVT family DNA-binding domain-containing protein [Chloroflexota bacterium]
MSWTVTITPDGQITLPKELREYLGVRPGDRVTFVVRNGEVMLKALPGDIRSLRGIFAISEAQDWERVRKKTMELIATDTAQEGLP